MEWVKRGFFDVKHYLYDDDGVLIGHIEKMCLGFAVLPAYRVGNSELYTRMNGVYFQTFKHAQAALERAYRGDE